MPPPAAALHPRDLAPTGFTAILEALVQGLPEALCAVFVDGEGETIDYASRIDPFDARIVGAEAAIPLSRARALARLTELGDILELRIDGARRTLLARHVTDDCTLVLVVDEPSVRVAAVERCAQAAQALCIESGHPLPGALRVLRAVERQHGVERAMPRAFIDGGARRTVSAVLGVQRGPAHDTFLVRTDAGEELVVEHEHATGRWRRQS